MTTLRLLVLTSMLEACLCALPLQYNIINFGAQSGGKILCTDAIKEAVIAASKTGTPSEVVVPSGFFLTGAFSLASRVRLRIHES